MNKKKLYELMVILSPELAEAQATKIFDEIRTELADVTFEDIWGKRKLAYPMKNRSEGVYAVWNFKMDVDAVKELQEHLRLHPSVVRYLMVTIPEDYKQITHDEMDTAVDAYYENKQKNKSKSKKAAAARRAIPEASTPVAKKAEETEKPAVKPVAQSTPAPKVEEKIAPATAPAAPKVEAEKPVEAPKKTDEKKDEKKSELDEKLDKLLFGDDLNF
jgi:small subunit ribosomal protein S6